MKICSYCFDDDCGSHIEDLSFDHAFGYETVLGDEVSDCCEEPMIEIDDELWEYFQDIKIEAKRQGIDEWIDEDPYVYSECFEDNIEVAEVIEKTKEAFLC
jgi:hypothetical protein